MKKTTLCYIEKDEMYLMLHRNKKEHDTNKDKWIGVGGKMEQEETPDQCLIREVREESGLELLEYQFRGKIYFFSDIYEDEIMYLYTATKFIGELIECDEGELRWIEKKNILDLNLWEGDKVFLRKLLDSKNQPFELKLFYEGEELKRYE
ncbi:MAG: NUDIX hydrolase [Lachnospiraceae bacterium]